MKTNITYIISLINKALAFEWIAVNLNNDKFNVNFILLNSGDSELENYLKKHHFTFERIRYKNKKDIPTAIYKTYKFLKRNNTHIIHAHLFDAGIVGIIAAWLARIPKRIYTRHHSNYHHIYFPKAIKYDKLVNYLSTDIIAISGVVKNILITKEHVNPNKISLIHHGFKLSDFEKLSKQQTDGIITKYNPNQLSPVIGVISRYTEWKGVQYIIPAFRKLLVNYPNALLILANAEGDFKTEIKQLLLTIPSANYKEISFEENIFSLYKMFDVFVHVPISPEMEAFGQTYVEALISEIPSVFTLSGIANEFIKDHLNGIVVPYKNSEFIYNAINELLTDKNLAAALVINGKKDVYKRFDLNKMILSLENLYER